MKNASMDNTALQLNTESASAHIDSVRRPQDWRQRERALDPEQSFICEAPAGSGKTELLTQRVLTLLARVNKPEAVLAITFTRKAAAEMKARILGALVAGRGPEPTEAHARQTWLLAQAVLKLDAQQNWQLLTNPNRLQIRTFDSLCSMLTQALPVHSAMGSGVMVTEDAQPLYRAAVKELMAALESESPWSDDLAQLLAHLDNGYARLEDLLCKMLARRDAWLPLLYETRREEDPTALRERLEYHLRHALSDKVTHLFQLIPSHLHDPLCQLADFAASNLARDNIDSPITLLQQLQALPGDEPEDLPYWIGLVNLVLTKDGSWRKRLDKNGGFPPGEGKAEKEAFKQRKEHMQDVLGQLQNVPDLLDALQAIAAWPAGQYQDAQWRMLQALTNVLPIAVAHLQLVFRARGEVDFVEISTRARQALGDEQAPTDLALRLDHTIQHILVDEFQDTSFGQIELLQKLTAGWQPGDGRTLFCVGDAMQSIYGFRDANVGLFLHCKEHGLAGLPLEPLQLTANFRSQAGVVNWINRVFQNAFPAHHNISSGAVAYSQAEAFRPELPGRAVETHFYAPELPDAFEGELVCDLIRQARAENPDGTIALLVRNRNHAIKIVPALKAAGLSFRAVDLELLATQPVVMDLMSLTRSLLFPADRIHGLAVLRAPWCGLSLADLEHIANQGAPNTLVVRQMQMALEQEVAQSELFATERCLSADGRQRLARVAPILQNALLERHRKPLRQWVEGVWLMLGGPACLQQASERDDAERFFQLLEKLNAAGGPMPTAEQLENGLAKLFAAPDPQADERLQIMTMHKSKGLEFDTVILPGLHRQPRHQDPELLLWQERLSLDGHEEWLLAPISPTGQEKDPIYKHLEFEQKKRMQLEACRLLYVACTRARKKLHLLAKVKSKEDEVRVFSAPSENTLLHPIWSGVHTAAHFYPAPEKTSEETADELLPVKRPILRLDQTWQLPTLPEVDLLKAYIAHYQFDNRNIASQNSDASTENAAALAGTLTHRILHVIGQQGLAYWQKQDLNDVQNVWRMKLLNLGVKPEELNGALFKVKSAIQLALQHPQFQWLLSGSCRFELPISLRKKGTTEKRVLDVVREDSNGTVWVVDYKTDLPQADESEREFIQRTTQHYKKIMSIYRNAIQALGYQNVQCALFFVAQGEWVEVGLS